MGLSRIVIFTALLAVSQTATLTSPKLGLSDVVNYVNDVLECIEDVAENGIKDTIDPLDPVKIRINEFDFNSIGHPLLSGTFTTDSGVTGLFNWKVLDPVIDLVKGKIGFTIVNNKLAVNGKYKINLKFLDFDQAIGDGNIDSTFTESSISGFITINGIHFNKEKLDGIDDIIKFIIDVIQDMDVGVSINIETVEFKITGMTTPDSDELNKYINKYLNNILEEYLDVINETLNNSKDKLAELLKQLIGNKNFDLSTGEIISAVIKKCITGSSA